MTFDPTTLAGKVLWLRGKDLSTGNVSTWADQSGLSHAASSSDATTTVVDATGTPAGGKCLSFTGSGYFSTPALAGIVAVTDSSHFATSGADGPGSNVIDGTNFYWTTAAVSSGWVRLQYAQARVLTQYGITRRDDIAARNPTAWTFEGSNDGTTFTTLDTRSGITWPLAGQTQTFTFSNTTAYLYYRLNVSANGGDTYLSINELVVSHGPAAEMWLVVKSAGTPKTYGEFSNTATSGDQSYYTFSDGKVYESFGLSSGQRQSFTPSVATTSWRLYRVANNGTTWQAWLDGTSQGTLAGGKITWKPVGYLGRNRGGSDNFSGGRIAEILIREAVSTTDEVSWMIDYFNTEHGLTVPGGSPPPVVTPTTTVAAPATVGLGFTATTVLTTTVAAPTTVGAGFSAKTVLASTLGLAASVGLAFSGSAIASTTVDAPATAGLSFAASTVEAGTTTLAMPASLGASFTAATVESVTTTVAAPATVGLGFDAHATATTSLDAPVTAGLSFAATKLEPTTLALPVTVGAGFSASLGGGTTLPMPVHVELFFTARGGDTIGSPWTSDLSGKTLLPFVTSGSATATPPLAVVPAGYTERPIMRASRSVPDLRTIEGVIVDPVTNQPRLTDDLYFSLPVTEAEVGVPHLIFHHQGKVVDATYFRGGFTKILTDRREEPFGDATMSFEMPNLSSMDEVPDSPDHPLWFIGNRANVQIEIVKSDGSSRIVWTGHVVATDTGNSETSPNKRFDCVGSLFQASTDRMHPPTFLDPTDIGTLMSRVLTAVTSRRYPVISAVATGIMSRQRGSWADSPLAFVQSLLSTAWTPGGNQWTIAKVEGSRRSYEIRLKKTAPEWTVTNGAHGVSVDLTRDDSSIRNVIYGHGVGPDGNAWFNYKYPNLHDDTAPAYPFASPSSVITVGTTDAMTTSGDGVSAWQRRARDLGYKLAIDGVFNTSDAEVARYVQRRFGASVDGVVGPQTWNATFGVGSNSGDLSAVIRLPLAADPRTQRYLYHADGSIAGENPDFDGNEIIYADDVDFGAGITRAEGIASAQQIVERESEPGLTGRITLTQDPREGSRLLIPPGDKITLVGYEGGDRVLHITAVERDWQSGAVTLDVDEKSRDAMTVAQIRSRDKEARRDPARRPGNPNRRSRLDVDQVVPFDGESGAGVIPKLALFGGLWTVIRIPVSETGRVAKMHLEAGSPFAIAFFGAPITPAHLVSYVGNPLASDAPFEPHAKQLDAHWFIEGFGQKGQRCGYYPGAEDRSTPFTGVEEQGGFEYTSSRPPWVWVAMYASASCFLEGNIYPDTVI